MAAELNFVRQQGFRNASPETCIHQYPALMLQPRIVGVLVLAGMLFQPWPHFLALSALLWWNAALPRLNPFDALYNQLMARPKGRLRLEPAPTPRRFAQSIAGTLMFATALSLLLGWRPAAWFFESVMLAALGALIFGRFCMGSYLYFVLTGQADFARNTLPWARGD